MKDITQNRKQSVSYRPHLLLLGGWTQTLAHRHCDISYIGSFAPCRSFDPAILKECIFIGEADIGRLSQILYLAEGFHRKRAFDAVWSFTELGLENAALLARILNIRGLSFEAVFLSRYKDQLRKTLEELPELAWPYKKIDGKQDDAEQKLSDFYNINGPKIILKPVDGSGGRGVRKIFSPGEISKAVEDLDKCQLLVEKYIDTDIIYSIETSTFEGKHYITNTSIAKLSGHPHILHEYIIVPSTLSGQIKAQCAALTKKLLNHIGLKNGAAHTEIKLNGSTPIIIETQTRVGGDKIWLMSERCTGISQIEEIAKIACELPVSQEIQADSPRNFRHCMFFALLPPAGRVSAIRGWQELQAHEAVLEAYCEIQPGTQITEITDNTQRKGYIVFQSRNVPHNLPQALKQDVSNVPDSLEDLYQTACAALQRFQLQYEDGQTWSPVLRKLPDNALNGLS